MQFQIDEAAGHLSRTPALLDTWLGGLPERWLYLNEGGDSWSPFDVLGHLIHGEKTDWIGRARIILSSESERTFVPFDRFAQYEATRNRSIESLLAEFRELREANVGYLREIDPSAEVLCRTGTHPAFGEVTLRQLLSTWVAHDWNHLSQIARILSAQLRVEVGPWGEYLPLMQRESESEPWDTRERK